MDCGQVRGAGHRVQDGAFDPGEGRETLRTFIRERRAGCKGIDGFKVRRAHRISPAPGRLSGLQRG